jgi:hypothetical protein
MPTIARITPNIAQASAVMFSMVPRPFVVGELNLGINGRERHRRNRGPTLRSVDNEGGVVVGENHLIRGSRHAQACAQP